MASEFRPCDALCISSSFIQTIGISVMAILIPPAPLELRCTVEIVIYVVVSIFGREHHISKTTRNEQTVNLLLHFNYQKTVIMVVNGYGAHSFGKSLVCIKLYYVKFEVNQCGRNTQ